MLPKQTSKQKLWMPDMMVGSVHELEPALLAGRGIKAVMVDLDETLVASNSHNLNPAYSLWFDALNQENIPALILSNGSPKRVAFWSQKLNVSGFALVGKPFLGFGRALKALGSKAHETAMIGDQLFTDILGANLRGITSILVKPLSSGGLPHTRLARKLEQVLLRRFIRGVK